MVVETVTIRGTSDGLVIHLGEGPLPVILEALEGRLQSSASFFVGGRVALRVGDRALSIEQLQAIGELLEKAGVTLWAVESTHPTTCASTQAMGLECNLRPTSATEAVQAPGLREEMVGVVFHRTLHSGQSIQFAGHVVLIGDLNPGAEITAAGDVIIWGKLRGKVHAGAAEDEQAIICALGFAPSQIRIGRQIARSPERGHWLKNTRAPSVPEIARVYRGRIVVDPWNPDAEANSEPGSWKQRFRRLLRRHPRSSPDLSPEVRS
jgi:septum site-determining protein MinC